MDEPTIGFVGAGRIARTLAQAFSRAGVPVVAVASRDRRNAEALASSVPGVKIADAAQEVADCAALVLITVVDGAIAPTCEAIRWREGQAAVHCSGATPLDALAAARRAGGMVGGFHPLQMFANPEVALESLPGCAVAVEAAPPLLGTLTRLAERIGCRPFELPPGVRARYHASATYVGPFVIAVLREAAKLWESFGASEAAAMAALLPLLRGTVEAIANEGLAGGMGGCVARGDVGTVEAHLRAIEAVSPEMAGLYRELTARTIPLGIARGTLTPERAAAIEAVIRTRPTDRPVRSRPASP